ncbi:MAG: CvpA family protein [Pseudomonadota bacterium]
MTLTIADGVVALVVLVSALLAYNRGLVREVLSIGGWIVAALAGFYFAPYAAPLVQEAPYVGAFLAAACSRTAVASFIVVAAIGLVVLSIFTPVLSSAVQNTILGPFDRGLGFIFGVVRGILLIGVVYLVYDIVVTDAERLAVIETSASHAFISQAAEAIKEQAPTEVPAVLQTRIDALLNDCVAPSEDTTAILLGTSPA